MSWAKSKGAFLAAQHLARPRPPTWEARHGAKRRAIDQAILEECEREIEREEFAQKEAIAAVFGRPVNRMN